MDFKRDDLRRYARRDWAAPERLARRQRAAQPVVKKVAMAVALYEAARLANPGWPSEAARRADLESHVALRASLSIAGRVGAR